jgi:hypothetical protein
MASETAGEGVDVLFVQIGALRLKKPMRNNDLRQQRV